MNVILLYGTIGEDFWSNDNVTAAQFAKKLAEFGGEPVDIYVNSAGGNVFDGSAIYSAIQRYSGHVRVFIDGLAASAASYCILSADEVLISPSATMMIHNAFIYTQGNAEELRETAVTLDKLDETIAGIYQAKTGMSAEEVNSLMEAETWFTAGEAVAHGLADGFCEAKEVSNAYDKHLLASYKHVPQQLLDVTNQKPLKQETEPACNTEKTITEEGSDEPTRPAYAVVDGTIFKLGEKKC